LSMKHKEEKSPPCTCPIARIFLWNTCKQTFV
jgi:hypothetical protein